jgi:hypothetical protein
LLSGDVLNYHNDNVSDGQSLTEAALTPSDVNPTTFGKLLSTPVDGQVYAQPLYMAGVAITTGPHQGIHDVAYVATEHDSLYAIDAGTGSVLWQDSFINPAAGVTSVPAADVNSSAITPEIGITGTPVIDPSTNTLYLDANTKEVSGGNNHYVHRLHALDIGSGAEQFGGPYTNADTISNDLSTYTYVSGPTVNGTGEASVNGQVHFNALRQLQRPGLTLANGDVYVAYGSHDDTIPYHGWLLGFHHAGAGQTLQLAAAFNTSPNGGRAAIWQSGGRVAADSAGNLYFETGNGTLDSSEDANGFPAAGDYGQSFVKVAPDPNSSPTNQNINGWGLKAVDYFTPYNAAALNTSDHDLGSGVPMVLPDSAGIPTHPHLLLGGGKLGTLYLIDRDNMGKFDPNTDHVVQEVNTMSDWTTPAYCNGQVYYVGSSSTDNFAETFSLSQATLSTSPVSLSPDMYSFPGSSPEISADGASDAVVWDVDMASDQLRAYDASSGYAQALCTSAMAANDRDALDPIMKFSLPTVADGKVFVGTQDSLTIFGLRNRAVLATGSGFGGLPGVGVFDARTGPLDVPLMAYDPGFPGVAAAWPWGTSSGTARPTLSRRRAPAGVPTSGFGTPTRGGLCATSWYTRPISRGVSTWRSPTSTATATPTSLPAPTPAAARMSKSGAARTAPCCTASWPTTPPSLAECGWRPRTWRPTVIPTSSPPRATAAVRTSASLAVPPVRWCASSWPTPSSSPVGCTWPPGMSTATATLISSPAPGMGVGRRSRSLAC